MWIITYKGKIVSVRKLYKVEERFPSFRIADEELDACMSAMKKSDVIALYLHRFGYTWKERPQGVEATKV